MQINDDPAPKPAWKSWTNIGAAVTALTVFLPPKWQPLVDPTWKSVVEIGGILTVLVGRWRAGGVSWPMIGAKQK